jgi:putative transcriptional regulator
MSFTLKNRLAECRAAKGVKKSQLAYYIGKSRGYVTRLERGDIRPSAEDMIRIARYFGKPVEYVFQLVEASKQEIDGSSSTEG